MRITAVFCALATTVASVPSATDRAGQWREDLEFFASHFSTAHIDFARLWDKSAFDAEIRALEQSAADLPDSEITLRLMKLVASAGVAHTQVIPRLFRPFHRLPLNFAWYSDGLAVVGAAPEYRAAQGTYVVRIGSKTPEEVLRAAAPYLAHENDSGLRNALANQLMLQELLQKTGAAGDRVEFTLTKPGGDSFTLAVAPGDPHAWRVERMFDVLPVPDALYRKNPESYYWYEYLPDAKALYIQYQRCEQDPKLKFADFTRGLFAFADTHATDRLIIDLRFNGGGDSRVIGPLKNGLKSRAALSPRVLVLVGSGTFSSALMNAIELRDEFHATLVGEAPGERPNSYGEVKSFTLPNSQLRVQCCTKFFRQVKSGDPLELKPDILAARTLRDTLSGHDPVLEAALRAHL